MRMRVFFLQKLVWMCQYCCVKYCRNHVCCKQRSRFSVSMSTCFAFKFIVATTWAYVPINTDWRSASTCSTCLHAIVLKTEKSKTSWKCVQQVFTKSSRWNLTVINIPGIMIAYCFRIRCEKKFALPVATGKMLGKEGGGKFIFIVYFYIIWCHIILPNNL